MDKAIIAELKEKYGDVFHVEISKKDYIFRSLTFSEYDGLVERYGGESVAEAEDALVQMAVVWPEEINFDKMRAGVVTSLAEEILEASGFTDYEVAKTILNLQREKAVQFRNQMKTVVVAAMPAYKLEDLDNLTFSQLAYKVAVAEEIFKLNDKEIVLDLVDPAQVAEEAKTRDQQDQEREYNRLMNDPDAHSRFGAARIDDPIAQRLNQALG